MEKVIKLHSTHYIWVGFSFLWSSSSMKMESFWLQFWCMALSIALYLKLFSVTCKQIHNGREKNRSDSNKGNQSRCYSRVVRSAWVHCEFANDFIAIRLESQKRRNWEMNDRTSVWANKIAIRVGQGLGEIEMATRKNHSARCSNTMLCWSDLLECVHLRKLTSISLCWWPLTVAQVNGSLWTIFNVPPNLFDIIYKMTTFIWHHDNRKFAFAS